MTPTFPPGLDGYPAVPGRGLLATLAARVDQVPFNAVATAIFGLAILHTFVAARVAALAHRRRDRELEAARAAGLPPRPSFATELLHFLGEIEVVFGLWAIVLVAAMVVFGGWEAAKHYVEVVVNYTEPLFVVVIMALASTRPIVELAERMLQLVAKAGGCTPSAWWIAILALGPMLGSFITEPAAMTICAVLLGRHLYARDLSPRLKYGTLGLLFVNISIGGTLTHFAAPPVLMVARPWGWNLAFMMEHFGWKAVLATVASTALYWLIFRNELRDLAARAPPPSAFEPEATAAPSLLPVPPWVTLVQVLFMAWTVANAHYPALFLGGFLFFLGFARATAAYQSRVELKTPLLVGFFLAGLVIHGGLQSWWIAPVLGSLPENPLFLAAATLTAFNDNALITYLATLVPNLADPLRLAVVQGAVVAGGVTVIANAPNPAGQALLARFFGGAISPLWLCLGALPPTLIAALVFRLL